MIVLEGKGVFGGIVFGKLAFHARCSQPIDRREESDWQAELTRFEQAVRKSVTQLGALYEKALAEVGENDAMIFQIHQMMLEDLDYQDSVTGLIRAQRVNAEYAVRVTADRFADVFARMDDAYMRGRAADVRDVSERLVNVLCGVEEQAVGGSSPVILAADDFAPSETVRLDKKLVLALVTRSGSVNSHTAILTRTMNIPAVVRVGEGLLESYSGSEVIVDGFAGRVYLDPDAQTVAMMRDEQASRAHQRALLATLKGKENVTKDGCRVALLANISRPTDVAEVIQCDAGGIGLFRSEFLFLERDAAPSEQTQFEAYRTVLEAVGKKRVIIRTLDLGADKQVPYLALPQEENPAMGMRAIRICLERPELFRTQLRALYRASAYGNLAIMFPMITSVEQVRESKRLAEQVRAELVAQGIPIADAVELGIMIETPAAALISDLLAREVDFFSIGTNDLTQYTLAVDRQNPGLERFYDAHHRAVLRLLRMVTESAHQNGVRVGICGELAADPALTEAFLAIGVDALSVSPGYLLELRQRVRETDVGAVRQALLEEFF